MTIMKKLLLAFTLIGFIATSSYASSTFVKTNSEVGLNKDGDGDKCTKKNCKHDSKECAAHKNDKATSSKKACCANKTAEKKSCCASKSAASCDKSKSTDTKKAAVKKDDKETK